MGGGGSRVDDEAAIHPEIQSVSNDDIQVPVLDGGGGDQAADAEGQYRHHAHH